MILPLFRKAIATCEVAVVCNVKTERLDNRLSRLEVAHKRLIAVLGEQLFAVNERLHSLDDLFDFLRRELTAEFLPDSLLGSLRKRLRSLQFSDQRLRHLHGAVKCGVCDMHRAGVYIHHDGNAVVNKLMNQAFTCFLSLLKTNLYLSLCGLRRAQTAKILRKIRTPTILFRL